jgi:hypothetical protein
VRIKDAEPEDDLTRHRRPPASMELAEAQA